MSELSFEQMLEESFKTIHNGEVVEGTVIDVKEDEIVLNIGCKADGIITRSEYTNDSNADLRELVHVNDTMEAKVLKVNISVCCVTQNPHEFFRWRCRQRAACLLPCSEAGGNPTEDCRMHWRCVPLYGIPADCRAQCR